MRRQLGWVALVVFAVACVPSPRRNPGGFSSGGGQVSSGGSSSSNSGQGGGLGGSPRQQLNEVDQHLRSRGYTPVGPAVRNPSMPSNGVTAYSIDVQRGRCYTAVAMTESGNDLNMVVLDPNGRTVGYNVDPDPHPWIHLCPNTSGQFVARLQMARGHGEYYYAAYHGQQQSDPGLTSLFGKEQQQQARKAELDAQTRQRLQSLDQQLAQENFERAFDPRGVVMNEGEDRNFPLNLEQGVCYSFTALAGQGARDTDVFIVDGGGNELARDIGSDRDGRVEYCPTKSGTYQLRARLYEGNGPVFVAGHVKSASASQPSSEGQEPIIAEQSEAGAGVEENFRLLDADMRARGYRSYDEPSRGQLTEGGTREFDIQLEGGKCYAILAVGDNGVRNLDLILLDGHGHELDRDMERDARPVVRVCPQQSGQFTMQVKMNRGEGNFVYAPYKWPRGTRGPFGLKGVMYLRVAEVTSLLSQEGYQPDPAYTPDRGSLQREGQSARHTFELEEGNCYSVLVVGGKGVANLDLTLSKGGSELATDESRNAFPSVRHCVESKGPFQVEVEAETGQGKYFYQVFRRSGEVGTADQQES